MNRIVTLLVILFLTAPSGIYAQIVYNDIVDTTITRTTSQGGTVTYIFDINNDGTNDYNINVKSQQVIASGCVIFPADQTSLSAWINTMPSYSNQVGDTLGSVAFVPFQASIDAGSHTWNAMQLNYMRKIDFDYPSCIWDSTISGNWPTDTIGYVALRFKLGVNVYYGWIRLGIYMGIDTTGESRVSVTIYEWAYNSTPNAAIPAGETTINSVNELFQLESVAFPNPATDEITIEGVPPHSSVSVYDVTGRLVVRKVLLNGDSKISLTGFKAGYYQYTTQSTLGNTTGRFMVR